MTISRYRVLFLVLCFSIISFAGHSQVYGEEIISWDFGDGIPEGWQRSSESDISQWEYRGPSTEPNNDIASRGSCGVSDPISSSTRENGFIIFDSNYWDDEEGPCGSLGSGQDPGPHAADLITAPVDLTNENSLVLTLQQQYKNFNCATSVQISIDGGDNYITIIENSSQQGFYSGDLNFASVNISSIAANQSDVRFKFHFEGLYYYWMIDDIVIYKPNENDLFLNDARYTAFDFEQGETGLSKLEYSIYPKVMMEPFQFKGDVLNIGNNTQTEIQFKAELFDESNNSLDVLSSPSETIDPAQSITLETAGYIPPNTAGDYRIDFSVNQDETDEDYSNNIFTKSYRVTDHTWGRDNNIMDGEFTHSSTFDGVPYEYGNYFEGYDPGAFKCSSITIAFSDSSEVGAKASAKILNFSRETILAQSEEYTINAWDLNSIGDAKFVTLQLEEAFTLDDLLYLAVVSSLEEEGRIRIATGGNSQPQTSILIYPANNAEFYTLTTPMIRMNIFPISANPGCTDSQAMNYNPLADTEDSSCRFPGCTNPDFSNYDEFANFDDGSCIREGCPDPEADNYDPDYDIANLDLCIYLGCMDPEANNFDETANEEDGSCLYNAAALAFDNTFGCAPFTITITNQTDIVTGAICSIDLGDETIVTDCEASTFDHTYLNSGEYIITYTYSVGDFSSEFNQTITISPTPDSPLVSYDGLSNELNCSNCDDANIYNWFLNDELLLSDSPFNIINPEEGNYILELDNGGNCYAQSELIAVVSVAELSEIQLKVYPVPATNHIYFNNPHSQLTFEIFDSSGRFIATGDFSGVGIHSIDISGFTSGTYILKGTTTQGQLNSRFIKE